MEQLPNFLNTLLIARRAQYVARCPVAYESRTRDRDLFAMGVAPSHEARNRRQSTAEMEFVYKNTLEKFTKHMLYP